MFGKKINELRLAKGLPMREFAELIEVSENKLSKIEGDFYEPELTTVIKIVKYFNVSVEYLIGRTEIRDFVGKYDIADIGNKIKNLRYEKGLHREECAKEIGMNKLKLIKIENKLRNPEISDLVKVADYFKVSIEFLLLNSKISDMNKESHSNPSPNEVTDPNTFGEKVRELRFAKNIPGNDFSKLIGVTEHKLSMIEGNESEPNFDTLIKIADYFKVSLDYLLREQETMVANNN